MQIKALEYLFKTFVLIDGTPTDNFDVDIRPKTTNQTRTIELPATKADQDQYTPTDAAGQDLPVSKFTPDPKRKLKVKVEQAEGLESFSEEGTP